MIGKPIENDFLSFSKVNNPLYWLISISIIGAAFIVVMLAGCMTALEATINLRNKELPGPDGRQKARSASAARS